MSQAERAQIIREIEQIRQSRLLCYLTGDRRGFETRIHTEIHTMLYHHLRQIGHTPKLDLFLYSTGGVTMAAWSIINLLREFCDHLAIIVPYKAYSTATLICLGADEIIMGKLGQLGPVDPSVTMPFNPSAPGGIKGQVLPVSVEEVASFIEFCKDDKFIGLKSEMALSEVLKQLTAEVHPLAIGSVYRAIEQIRMISTKLLKFHMTTEEDESEINRIVEALSKNLYSHDYIINRREAKDEIKLKTIDAESIDPAFEGLVYGLFENFENEMLLNRPFNREAFLGADNQRRDVFKRAFIESTDRTDVFITEKELTKFQQQSPNAPVQQTVFSENILREGWEELQEEI